MKKGFLNGRNVVVITIVLLIVVVGFGVVSKRAPEVVVVSVVSKPTSMANSLSDEELPVIVGVPIGADTFEYASTQLTLAAMKMLEDVSVQLQNHPDMVVLLDIHVRNDDENLAQAFGQRRVESAMRFLLERGVAHESIRKYEPTKELGLSENSILVKL